MGAIWFLARTEMRHRWFGVMVLIVLVGIVGAAFLASAAGARRTSSALARFESTTDAATLEFNVKNGVTPEQLAALKRVPGVAQVGLLRQLAMFNPDLGFPPTGGPIDDVWGRTIDRPRLLSGRVAHGADEVNIGQGLARNLHLGVGDTLPFQSFTPGDVRDQLCTNQFDPNGPAPNLQIAGIVRRPLDLGARGDSGGVVVMTRPFMEKYGPEIGTFVGTVIRLRTEHGDADVRRVTKAARRMFGGEADADAALADAPNCVPESSNDIPDFGALGIGVEGEGAQSAVDISTAALWVLAGVTAAAGLVAIAFALARRMADEVEDEDTLRALGLARQQRWATTVVQAVPIAVGGALLAVVVAWLASPLFPIGVARDAEPAPGLHFDAAALLVGAIVVIGSVMVVSAVAAVVVTRRRTRAAARPSRVARAISDAGVAPPVAVGVGFALGRGRGRVVPVWSTIGAITIGVVGVVAALVFASSLDRLVDTPSRYGWTWGVVLDGYGGAEDGSCPKSDPARDDPGISALTQYCYANNISIAGRPAVGSSFRQIRGRIEPTIVDGRAPRNPREIALGAKLLASTHKSIGDQVVVGSGDLHRKYDIVGTTVLPGLGEARPLAGGALFTEGGLERIAMNPVDRDNYVIVRLDPDADQRALFRRLSDTHANLQPIPPSVPAEIERIRQIDTVPAILAGLTVVIAAIAMAYTLVVSVRRRRRELAILRTVGFTRGQVRAAVAWQATTLAAIGLVLGILIGFVVGERVWHTVADDLGVSSSIAVPTLGVVLLIPLTVLVANVIAAVPARSATRTPPSVALRAE